jgi:hypothetical protein
VNYNPHAAFPQFDELNVDGDQFEFIELTNTSAQTVDLTGVRLWQQFGQGVSFEFGEQLLPPGEFVVIPRNRLAFVSRYGNDVRLARGLATEPGGWHYDGGLNNDGDLIKLVDARGAAIHVFRFDDDGRWPRRADGNGSSLEVFDFEDDYLDPANWESSRDFGGSPGGDSSNSIPLVVINEVLANSSDGSDRVELFNLGSTPVDVSGWYLTDSDQDYFKFQFGAGTVIGASGYLTVDQAQFGFRLDGNRGDDAWLIQADASGRPLAFADLVEFQPSPLDVSVGRWPEGVGRFVPQRSRSFGEANTGPILGDVNFDGRTDQMDLVQVAQRGKYLTTMRATFEDGDWNGDDRFDPLDFVAAMRDGGFVRGFPALDEAIKEFGPS